MQVYLMEAVRHLTGSLGELIADSTIGTGDAIVDGGGSRWRLPIRLEAQVIEQRRLCEVGSRDFAGMMNTRPPAHEVQQAMRVAKQALIGKPADMLAVEVPIDPPDTLAGGLFHDLNRAMRAR